jgi:4-hydroxybenzoate polyprenyltransferase/phosphoserine phosphatase
LNSETNPSAASGTFAGEGAARPLVIDLDGTLLHTDTLHESALLLLRNQPNLAVLLPFWLLGGKASLKQTLAAHVQLNVESLPYNHALIDYLRLQKKQGRTLVLCTATDKRIADAIALHLGLFDAVMATEGKTNLAGHTKAQALVERYGEHQFDYIGNAEADLAVWAKAKQGIVVNGSEGLLARAQAIVDVVHVIAKPPIGLSEWLAVFRVHQWVKNVLLFVPILAAHQVITGELGITLLLAFIAFSLCASSVYITNDLFDLESDRQHPRKCHRPFAAGRAPVWLGALLAPLVMALSFVLAAFVNGPFFVWLLIYFAITCAYSWSLKRLVLVDCLTLAILYTLRIVAGAAAVNVPLSFWLLALSIFLFVSLAFIMRYAELQVHESNSVSKVHGRGYYTSDASLVQQLGISSGFAAVLVLALYLNSTTVVLLYRTPELIWAAVPLMLWWLSWMWLKAHRGLMHDDPIVFAMKDKTSIAIGILFIATFVLARLW